MITVVENDNIDCGKVFKYNSILINEKKVGSVQMEIIDPNSNTKQVVKVPFQLVENSCKITKLNAF